MKLIAFLLILISAPIYSQEAFTIGLKEGTNYSQVANDSYKGFHKNGFFGGGFITARITKKWTVGLEVYYIEKGSRHRSNYAKGDSISYFLQLNYVEVPIMFKYYINGLNFEFGPSFGVLAATRELKPFFGVDHLLAKPFHRADISFNIGVGYTFKSNFGWNLRYSNSVVPIRTDATLKNPKYTQGQFNSVLMLSLFYEYELKKGKKKKSEDKQ